MHTAGPMSRFSEDLGPMLKVLSGSSIQRLNLDEPVSEPTYNICKSSDFCLFFKVDMKKIRFYYMSEMKSPVVGRVDKHQRLALKKVCNECITIIVYFKLFFFR